MTSNSDLVKWLRHMVERTGRNQYEIGHYWNAVEEAANALEAVEANLAKAREALNEIASWPEGATVTGSFDEPGAARTARDALKEIDDVPTTS